MEKYRKYPKTYHLPWSEGVTSDDKVMIDITSFFNKNIVITEKMDGENTTLYNDHFHARSVDSKDHESRHWIKQLHGQIKHDIPNDFRICGENVYAKHSIYYDSLPSYFLVFSIWNNDICLSWKDTVEWCKLLNLHHVPVLYMGLWNEDTIKSCFTKKSVYGSTQEGYVVRVIDEFKYSEFNENIIKFVRKNHVSTSKHWMYEEIIKNNLKKA